MSSKTVGTRLEGHDYRVFAEKAKRFGVKPGVYLRSLILSAIDPSGLDALHEVVSKTQAEVERLRKELSKLAIVLLVDAGKCKPSDAKSWVIENLGHPISISVR